MISRKIKAGARGSVALTAVLIVSAILLVGGLSALMATVDLAFSTKGVGKSVFAEGLAKTCLEESVNLISQNPSYVGAYSYADGDFSCNADISDDLVVPGMKQVSIDSDLSGYSNQEQYSVDTTSEPFVVTKID